jgi:hypothetical protein
MMETILFSFILLLIAVWLLLGILYFYMQYVSPHDFIIQKSSKKGRDTEVEGEKTKQEKQDQHNAGQTEFVLIGKSRSVSPIIPQLPSTSSSENLEQNINNFAPETSENTEPQKEEDNEMEVSYEMEREDENEVAREELSLPIESASEDGEVSSQSILARDLGRMRN